MVVQAKGAAPSGSEKDIVKALLLVLTQLSLISAAELRAVISVVLHTFLVPAGSSIIKAARAAGQAYHTNVEEYKKIDNEGERGHTLQGMGPPFIWSGPGPSSSGPGRRAGSGRTSPFTPSSRRSTSSGLAVGS